MNERYEKLVELGWRIKQTRAELANMEQTFILLMQTEKPSPFAGLSEGATDILANKPQESVSP